MKDYDTLFTEKLEMLIKLNEGEKITWKGKHTQTIENLRIYPRPYQAALSIWVADSKLNISQYHTYPIAP
jgi:alkanesulfonate monooxygenase SsuD/methylene tetrahydromethanopterin reductase-like flavin-dependent oxidoreductase (luciferase family)